MSTGAANRRKGSQYETDLVKFWRERDFDTERNRLSGTLDEGDLVVRLGRRDRLVVEAKSGKNIRPRFWYEEEAVPEAKNYAKRRTLLDKEVHAALAMKTHGKSIGKSLVTIDLEFFADLLRRAYADE